MIPAGAATSPPGAGAILAGRCTTTSSATASRPAAHPPPGSSSMGVALALFLLSPVTLLAWAAGQALLRITGLRWWKLALASLAAIAAWWSMAEGGPGPALAHHFSGYTGWLRQIGAAQLDYPTPGAFLWPQLPLAIPVGLLAAALNLAGRRQAIDPAEVKQQQREATRRMESAVRRAAPCATTTSAPSPSASRSTATSAGPTSAAWSSSPGSCRAARG